MEPVSILKGMCMLHLKRFKEGVFPGFPGFRLVRLNLIKCPTNQDERERIALDSRVYLAFLKQFH